MSIKLTGTPSSAKTRLTGDFWCLIIVMPSALRPTPFALRPTPFALHPTPPAPHLALHAAHDARTVARRWCLLRTSGASTGGSIRPGRRSGTEDCAKGRWPTALRSVRA
jgi:hypothetical protein